MNTPIENLQHKGYVLFSYPATLQWFVDRSVESWKKFCALPVEIKKGLPYSNDGAGVGYELKEGVGRNADRKENFDVAIGGRDWLDTHSAHIASPVVREFIINATTLVSIMKPLILDFARQAEKAYWLKGFVDEVVNGEDAFFVRFIRYTGNREVGEEIATAHADQSAFTLHLSESDPGFQYLSLARRNRKWVDLPFSDGETFIIPSMQMQLRSKGKLKALCHRVVATKKTAKKGRESMVCFVQLKNFPKYDKARHGRLQEKPAGFNYDMSPTEFKKLFK